MRRNPVLIGLATASLLAGCAHIAPPPRHPSSAAGASGSSATSALRPGALKNPPPQTRILWANCNAPPHAGSNCGAPPYPAQGWNFTNYLVSPENDVIAGAPTASPSKGAFILTDGSGAGMHFLPPGTGVPTITKWDPPDTLQFTTSTGASGTVNVRTGKITLLRTPAPSSVHSPRGVRRQPLSLLSVAMTGSHRGYALAATKQGGRARSVVTTSDGGVHWRTALRLSYNAREIVAPDATHAYLVADCVRPGCAGSVIMATDDGGRSWTTVKTVPISVM